MVNFEEFKKKEKDFNNDKIKLLQYKREIHADYLKAPFSNKVTNAGKYASFFYQN